MSKRSFVQAILVLWLLGACQRPAMKGGVVMDRHFFENMDSAAAHPSSVKTLYLSRQGIDTLPTSIKQLTNLETLIVSGNPALHVTDLVDKIKGLQKLRYLNLSFCELDSLPKEIGQLRYVTVLDIAGNRIRTLPTSIAEMHSLREVIFCDYKVEFRQWTRDEKLRALALLPHGHVILRDCFGKGYGKDRVQVTKDNLED